MAMNSIRIILAILLFIINDVSSQNGTCPKAKKCAPGVVLPVWQPQEGLQEYTIVFRAFIYLVALFYMFLGVSIVADRFMASIEVITSQERAVKMRKITGEPYTILVRVWNETVSNLTLMALGSSAPEILLSVIEIFGNDFEAGDLGPSTIVGSAAFNLFIIIAVCIYVIPPGEVRQVQHKHVFWVTLVWSMFAYIWLYLIICVISPNEVEAWEGLLTFIFFPLTVISAYLADNYTGILGQRFLGSSLQSFFRRRHGLRGNSLRTKIPAVVKNEKEELRASLVVGNPNAEATVFEEHRKHYLEIFRDLRSLHPDVPIRELEKLAMERVINEQKKSRAFYRIQTTRKLIGQGDIRKNKLKKKAEELVEPLLQKQDDVIVVEFNPSQYTCLENVNKIKVKVRCDRGSTDPNSTVTVHYRTVADTAQEHSDFVPTEGLLVFKPGVSEQEIEIIIVDNDVYEEDEQFLVRLSKVRAHSTTYFSPIPVRLGAASTATVLIVDDDHAGAFGFASEKFKVVESSGKFVATILRTRGARGEVSIPYKTVDGLAKAGKDYEHCEGVIQFVDEQIKAEIHIPIINDDEYEKNEDFFIELGEPIWHSDIEKTSESIKGRPVLTLSRCKVIITEDKEFKNFVDRMLTNANTSFMVGTSSWKQQFKEATTLEEGEDGDITWKERFMHYLSLPWKVVFALIPPTDYYNGWLCFITAIVMIGILTAVIGDLASHFGCTVGMKDTVTAISLVAMGTSVPDMFASRTAAIQDKWADSSIGNVTGSNAINVFMGIGTTWAIAACVHAWRGSRFIVSSGSLAFSVTLFIIGSVICITVLQYRRYSKSISGELGGPIRSKYISSAIFLFVWLLYVMLSTLEAYCIISGF